MITQGALEAYTERELPKLREEVCILRKYKLASGANAILVSCSIPDCGCSNTRYIPCADLLASVSDHDRQDLLYKQFQKSPENPCVPIKAMVLTWTARLTIAMHRFNQATVSYDASKEEKVEALKRQQDAVANRLREK